MPMRLDVQPLVVCICAWVATANIRTLPPDPADGITQEMMDMEEYNRKQGMAMGYTGEFFRYKHVFHQQPTEANREEAISIGSKIRCDVCAITIDSLLKKASSLSEDGIADVLEGNAEYEKTGDQVTDRMLEHKKGCNKHFKDELIAEGYTLRVCKDVIPGRTDSEPCIHKESTKPGPMAIDSYEQWKECLFHACEQSVSRFSDSLAEHLASEIPGSANRTLAIRTACETVARCASGGAQSKGAAPGTAKPPSKDKKKRRRSRKKNKEL